MSLCTYLGLITNKSCTRDLQSMCTYPGSDHVQKIGQKFGALRMCVLIRVSLYLMGSVGCVPESISAILKLNFYAHTE